MFGGILFDRIEQETQKLTELVESGKFKVFNLAKAFRNATEIYDLLNYLRNLAVKDSGFIKANEMNFVPCYSNGIRLSGSIDLIEYNRPEEGHPDFRMALSAMSIQNLRKENNIQDISLIRHVIPPQEISKTIETILGERVSVFHIGQIFSSEWCAVVYWLPHLESHQDVVAFSISLFRGISRARSRLILIGDECTCKLFRKLLEDMKIHFNILNSGKIHPEILDKTPRLKYAKFY